MTRSHSGPRRPPPLPHHPLVAAHVVVEIRSDPSRPGGRLVLQDGVESSYIDVLDPRHLEFEYLRHLARVIDVAHPKRLPLAIAQVGGGPCALARYLDATRRELRATVVERDPAIIAIATEWLGLVPSARLRLVAGDGRAAIDAWEPGRLDVLVIDAFDGVLVPHELVTAEGIVAARASLRPGGLHIVNMIDLPSLDYAAAVVAGLRDAYATVAVLADAATLAGASSGNLVLVARDGELPVERIAGLAARDRDPWQLVHGRRLDAVFRGGAPLRDDVAPAHALARYGRLWGRTTDAATSAGTR